MSIETDHPAPVNPLSEPVSPVAQIQTIGLTDHGKHLVSQFKHNSVSITAHTRAVPKEQRVFADIKNNFPPAIGERLKYFIGLDDVKCQLTSYFNLFRLNSYRTHYGLAERTVNANMVFTGNPGTGKTTIARLLGGILKDAGLLQNGHVVETSPNEMFTESSVGSETRAIKIKIQQARGGVLLIDEAHNFPEHAANSSEFWRNALTTLMQAMTKPGEVKFVVVLAGYQDGLQHLFKLEPGLKSRFQNFIHFKDYTDMELAAIFEKQAQSAQYDLASGWRETFTKALKDMPHRLANNRGNARFVNIVFDEAIKALANRVQRLSFPTKSDVATITAFDIKSALKMLQQQS